MVNVCLNNNNSNSLPHRSCRPVLLRRRRTRLGCAALLIVFWLCSLLAAAIQQRHQNNAVTAAFVRVGIARPAAVAKVQLFQGSSSTSFTTTTVESNSADLHSENHNSNNINGAVSTTSSSSMIVDAFEQSFYQQQLEEANAIELAAALQEEQRLQPLTDPSLVEFVNAPKDQHQQQHDAHNEQQQLAFSLANSILPGTNYYPFAAMLQVAGPYIANHAGKIAVVHIPGEIFDDNAACDALLRDIALCWLLDMKIILVASARYAKTTTTTTATTTTTTATSSVAAAAPSVPEYPHEGRNALHATSRSTLRSVEEEAGFLRTEMERKLNRCLRAHGGTAGHEADGMAPPEANVVSGNFYTAQRFGVVRGRDYQYTGFASETHTQNIRQTLDKGDVLLLSTVGLSPTGDLVNVNGYHLAATVAASLKASKVIYMSTRGSILQKKTDRTPIQELPLSFAQSIASYHGVMCSNMGFATFEKAKQELDPAGLELLLHMAWSSWAVSRGAKRAHIVHPADGALLEELYTAKNGDSTCIFHDDELKVVARSDGLSQQDWDDFFDSAPPPPSYQQGNANGNSFV